MRVGTRTIEALQKVITGNDPPALGPYRSGPDLVAFFNLFGFDDSYAWGGGFPSRWSYCEDRLHDLNGTEKFSDVILAAFDPRDFMDSERERTAAVEFFNRYLRFDGYEIVAHGDFCVLRQLDRPDVELETPWHGSLDDGHVFIEQQLSKASEKIAKKDYDGAITNARSMLEAIFWELEKELAPASRPPEDGDLLKQYKRVQKLLNLEPGRPDLATALKQVLTGLSSVVSGLAGASNKMGDRHARRYRPDKHHAKLVVNSAKTLADFLIETREYQAK